MTTLYIYETTLYKHERTLTSVTCMKALYLYETAYTIHFFFKKEVSYSISYNSIMKLNYICCVECEIYFNLFKRGLKHPQTIDTSFVLMKKILI